ncbi:hypothetical protein [Mycoplasma mycoides]|uniref:hypothetical protein n=1 Tax=Mycoplasma mycoides TaxID=2102 RepID=UPI0027329CAD|nr:hypothetical protein [Mycoplasma mycoides]MDP4040762.1 hypothetical protein [Mycoplasma mycoides]MDP4041638.1 hypothetical protein [Mycoplasma mycoides]MDP4042526.1 hypothetical protein [Mycoplasma mycoides]MDP4044000.1 hypothetical protein [Mycoplasma mycoides]MDP4044906.1 hypothetical protein [Mycoplasma mycoides]
MSYYYRHNFSFSYHGLQRAKERLKLKDKKDYEVKEICLEHIRNSTKSFMSGNEIYISASNTNIFFVVNKQNNLIITVTEISAEKQLRMYGI